ncbi:Dihydrodiol dehydrogenase 3 [Amphibalanus amphitrite]|uniref:Dihydrodiol dehydrogenase 3 n=1 Tax=Amphibalanus amphitrite TaxID=1232801 RepID=A0A6A4VDX8_AMPAM|nr:Dihydrodiol dehydrogenase 3 [Amphibalanus amphitrite]
MATTLQLNSGHKMPLLGLGCWRAVGDEISTAVETALLAGYRHIDTAELYHNEADVGRGIRAAIATGKVKRSDVFVVTKLPSSAMRPERVEPCLRRSLAALGLDSVDLYLVHSPVGALERSELTSPPPEDGRMPLHHGTDLIAVWKEMERMVSLGLAKSIGVSNYNERQMRKTLAIATIPPAVLQVECHVYFQQLKMREFCKKHNIAITAYAPLASPGRKVLYEKRGVKIELPDLLNNPVVRLVAEKHKRTAAQVLLRFLVQQDIIVIPKSTNAGRIKENSDIFSFKLDELDMKALSLLDQGEAGRSFKFYDSFPGVDEHPEFPFPVKSTA